VPSSVESNALVASGPALSPDSLVFKFSRTLPWMMLGASILFLGVVAFVLAWRLTDPTHSSLAIVLLCLVLFGSFAALCLRSFRRLRDSVAVNFEGIWYLPSSGEPTFIAWREIASVNALDTQQRLVLLDASGRRSIRLEYQLENFARLRDFVLRHTASATQLRAPSAEVFHRTWINKSLLLGGAAVFLFAAWLSFKQSQPGSSLFFIVFVGLIFVAITRDPARVVITREGVVIKYLGWEQTIPFDAISGIVLEDVHYRGNVWAAVTIEKRHGRPIKLFRFSEGSVALHNALKSAWCSATGRPTLDSI
jgi:hypothetical protein